MYCLDSLALRLPSCVIKVINLLVDNGSVSGLIVADLVSKHL